MVLDWSVIKHFPRHEWVKDPDKVDPHLVLLMDSIRERCGVKMFIHVAWADDGHSPSSWHYAGKAVDFHFDPKLSHIEAYHLLKAIPVIGGLGFYPFWNHPGWHIDLRPRRLYWIAKSANEYVYDQAKLEKALL